MRFSRSLARISAFLFVFPLVGIASCNLSGKNGSASTVSAKLSVVSVTPSATTAKGLSPARTLVGTQKGFTQSARADQWRQHNFRNSRLSKSNPDSDPSKG